LVMAYKKAVGTDYIPENYGKQAEKKRVKTSRKPGWLLRVSPGMGVIALIFLIGMSFVAQHVWINYLGFQITELKKEIVDIQTSNEKLKLKIANLVSLDKVEEVAIGQLGMIYPNDQTVHYIFAPKAQGDKEDAARQLAGLVTSSMTTETEEVTPKDNFTKRAWLGTVQDYFYHWLMGDSKS